MTAFEAASRLEDLNSDIKGAQAVLEEIANYFEGSSVGVCSEHIYSLLSVVFGILSETQDQNRTVSDALYEEHKKAAGGAATPSDDT